LKDPMKKIIPGLAVLALAACQPEKKAKPVTYPETVKKDCVLTYFDTELNDPYMWLEDDRSEETEAWVKEQNGVTFGFLDNIPFREQLKGRLEKLWNYEKIGSPFKRGDYT